MVDQELKSQRVDLPTAPWEVPTGVQPRVADPRQCSFTAAGECGVGRGLGKLQVIFFFLVNGTLTNEKQ